MMAVPLQIKLLIISILISDTLWLCLAEPEPKTDKEKEELSAEETKKLEIIKRIKKINEDGSYTIGYEADDGSFKIESRDVLGHIKGTYGFVDQDGQIKRVTYSTTNSTEILSKPPEEAPPSASVVQRIPSKKQSPGTFIFTSTQSTPTTTSVTASKRILNTVSSTTSKPNYKSVVNVSNVSPLSRYVTYTSAAPKVLLQGKPSPASGQISRPEVVTIGSTQSTTFKGFSSPDEKPVTEEEEPEVRGNILRRELPQRPDSTYNIREHIFTLQQSMGADAVDVYSGSMTTGTPRPLFTTTARSLRPVLFSSIPTTPVPRSTTPFPLNYLKNSLQDIENSSPSYQSQETTTEQPDPTPVVQIPANRPEVQEPLVAIRHPNQKNPILVPLSHLQGRIIPLEQVRQANEDPRQYYVQASRRPAVEVEQQQAVVRRLPPYPLRPMPVQVDEHGYIRELPRHVPTPYPVPVPATPVARYIEADNDIDKIHPPVSTKDFQRLLQQLILRQSRLEKISALTRQPPEMLIQPEMQRYRQFYQQPPAYFVQRQPRPVQYVPQNTEQRPNYVDVDQQQLVPLTQQQRPSVYDEYDSVSYRPNRRVARLLPSDSAQQDNEEYLPSDVREMLLLRMLQLAINPALPLDEEDVEVTKSMPVKRTPVRNVEILGEEESTEKSKQREKRYIFLNENY
uniref:Uncharacterized protein LOC114324288 n=1 Tax=Diabrotica virgifera virgifera TaxID=50390 RepID=A0A6P7F1V2_DIAVI